MQNMIRTSILVLFLISTVLFSKTLVTINGHKITDNIIPKGYDQLDDTKRENLIEHLIKEELIHAYLFKQNIVNTQEFKDAFKKQKELAQKQYKKVSGKSLTKEQIRNIKGSIALILYQQKQFESRTISENELRNFYNNNREKFDFPDSIEIADIIVQTENKAKQIIKTLKQSKNLDEDFIKVAREHKQNGYMGWFGRGMAPENLFNTSYNAKVKTLILKTIKTKHGYHVIYLLNKKTAGKLSYEEAKKNIKSILKQQKVLGALEDKVNELYGNAEVVY